MSELPQGWAEAKLGDVCLVFESGDPGWNPDAQFTYVDIGAIDNKTQTIAAPKRMLGADAPSRARRVIKADDVLFSTVRTYLKNIAMVPQEFDGAFTSTGIAVLRPGDGVEPRYLFNWVTSDEFITEISKSQDGTLYPAVTDKDVFEAGIRLAPVPEQRRIVAKVDGLTARTARARKELDRIPTLIARYKQRLLALAFSGELTAGWRAAKVLSDAKEVALVDVAKGFSYGTSAKSAPSGEVPVLRMGNIQDGKLDWTNLVFTSDKAEIKKYMLIPGDVLFNRTNSPELVGKTALYKGEQDAVYAGYLIRIQCTEKLMPEYLTYSLNGPAGRDYCWAVKTDGVSQSNINAKKIAAFRFLLPSLDEQAEIVRRIDSAFGWLDRMAADHAAAARLLPKLDAAILAKAFQGKLVPQDPNDEPAAKLLERIKAERGIAPKGKRGRKANLPPITGTAEITLGPVTVSATGAVGNAPTRARKVSMTKSRQDDDVKDKPYLAGLLKSGRFSDAQSLFRAADLPVSDFYKQLAWEIDKGHILDNAEELKAA